MRICVASGASAGRESQGTFPDTKRCINAQSAIACAGHAHAGALIGPHKQINKRGVILVVESGPHATNAKMNAVLTMSPDGDSHTLWI
ncbi:hypothetical protein B7486_04615 [cyanobacterium TDX16]|nr:hypothetical protein B7486_04615 [cyanobacterium TDX16]